MDCKEVYKECYMIRAFEKKVEKEFENGKMRGTTHGCVGQEIIPVLLMQVIDKEKDYITGTHRCHGQVLAYTKDPYRLACEMMGKEDGFNAGMGGSQHIKVEHYITNGVTGGMAAVGVGMALSLKWDNREGVVVSFLGDGGFEEGYVTETLRMASTYEAPILYILENNHYAMSTPTGVYTAGSPDKRIEGINIRYIHADVRDLSSLETAVQEGYKYVKENRRPAFIEVNTFRLCGHSKSDEREYMSQTEKEGYIADDPMRKLRLSFAEQEAGKVEESINAVIEDAFERAGQCRELDFSEYVERRG